MTRHIHKYNFTKFIFFSFFFVVGTNSSNQIFAQMFTYFIHNIKNDSFQTLLCLVFEYSQYTRLLFIIYWFYNFFLYYSIVDRAIKSLYNTNSSIIYVNNKKIKLNIIEKKNIQPNYEEIDPLNKSHDRLNDNKLFSLRKKNVYM